MTHISFELYRLVGCFPKKGVKCEHMHTKYVQQTNLCTRYDRMHTMIIQIGLAHDVLVGILAIVMIVLFHTCLPFPLDLWLKLILNKLV